MEKKLKYRVKYGQSQQGMAFKQVVMNLLCYYGTVPNRVTISLPGSLVQNTKLEQTSNYLLSMTAIVSGIYA